MKALFGFALALSGIGCASVTSTPVRGPAYPPKPENCKMPILTEKPRNGTFAVVCNLHGRGPAIGSKDVRDVLDEMMKEACKCGADALYVTDSKNGETVVFGAGEHSEATGVALKLPVPPGRKP